MGSPPWLEPLSASLRPARPAGETPLLRSSVFGMHVLGWSRSPLCSDRLLVLCPCTAAQEHHGTSVERSSRAVPHDVGKPVTSHPFAHHVGLAHPIALCPCTAAQEHHGTSVERSSRAVPHDVGKPVTSHPFAHHVGLAHPKVAQGEHAAPTPPPARGPSGPDPIWRPIRHWTRSRSD